MENNVTFFFDRVKFRYVRTKKGRYFAPRIRARNMTNGKFVFAISIHIRQKKMIGSIKTVYDFDITPYFIRMRMRLKRGKKLY